MEHIGEPQLRRSLVNASRSEAKAMALPPGFGDLGWNELDFLGWRDPKAPLRGYLFRRLNGGADNGTDNGTDGGDGDVIGVMLRAAESSMARRVTAMCTLCRSSRPGSEVSLFTARLVGPSGRNGNTVGTYICADLGCCANARMAKSTPTLTLDPGLTTSERIEKLGGRVDAFLGRVLSPA